MRHTVLRKRGMRKGIICEKIGYEKDRGESAPLLEIGEYRVLMKLKRLNLQQIRHFFQ